jgi:hypothetical protein
MSDQVKVLEPSSLKNDIKQHLMRTIKLYKWYPLAFGH